MRIACAWCFIGHGAWGLYRKHEWLQFYEALGVGEDLAVASMPFVGLTDIALGVLVLIRPWQPALMWMVAWGVFTALLRPLAGLSWWEVVERAGNFIPPAVLLLLMSYGRDEVSARRRLVIGKLGVALLMIGHGMLMLSGKEMFSRHWSAIGVELGVGGLGVLGVAEVLAGIAVLVVDSAPLLIGVAVWKVLTELLFPIAGSWMDWFEWVERGGDYFLPLAAVALMAQLSLAAHGEVDHG